MTTNALRCTDCKRCKPAHDDLCNRCYKRTFYTYEDALLEDFMRTPSIIAQRVASRSIRYGRTS